MKKKIFTRVLALLGAVFAVASLAVVPAFADIYSDSVRTQKIQFEFFLSEKGIDFREFYGDDSSIVYRAPSAQIWVDYDLGTDPTAPVNWGHAMCQELRFDFGYFNAGPTGYRSFCKVVADGELLFTLLHDDWDGDGDYEAAVVEFKDGTFIENPYDQNGVDGDFDIIIYVRYEWLRYCNISGISNYDCYYSPFEFFSHWYETNPSQYEQGYNDGMSVTDGSGYNSGYANGYTDGAEDGYNEGYRVGYGDGYDHGEQNGSKVAYDQGFAEGQTYGESLHADDWQFGYDIGYMVGVDDGIKADISYYDEYYNDYWSNFYQSSTYGKAVEKSIKSNDSNPVTAFFNSMWNGVISAYNTVTQNVSVGGVSLAMVITTIILAVVVIWLVRVLKS